MERKTCLQFIYRLELQILIGTAKPKQSVHIVAAADEVGGATISGDRKCGTDRIGSNENRDG